MLPIQFRPTFGRISRAIDNATDAETLAMTWYLNDKRRTAYYQNLLDKQYYVVTNKGFANLDTAIAAGFELHYVSMSSAYP